MRRLVNNKQKQNETKVTHEKKIKHITRQITTEQQIRNNNNNINKNTNKYIEGNKKNTPRKHTN